MLKTSTTLIFTHSYAKNYILHLRIASVVFMVLVGLKPILAQKVKLSTIADDGWANNSVNAVVFRKNALTTFKGVQYAAFYNSSQQVVLAKRNINSANWQVTVSPYRGDATDAHKSISIMVDGDGYLHVAWGQHNNTLNYARSVTAGSLELGKKEPMLTLKENKVSYPEFYRLKDGNLLFLYRDGGSGNGNLMINRYNLKTKAWNRVQDNLIDGEGKRNAYVQTAIDDKGTIHLSWVWRESPDVASNHDLCYAKSIDGGQTWQNSKGQNYQLPIKAENAEYAWLIPQQHELINQTSMNIDQYGNPYIATYWRNDGSKIPQYQVVYLENGVWKVNSLNTRKTAFSLSGGGTKKIPISRPKLISFTRNNKSCVALIFRDQERGNKVSVATTTDLGKAEWELTDLTSFEVGAWEPSFDTEIWKNKKRLDLFVQKVEQVDGEGRATVPATPVQVLTWKP